MNERECVFGRMIHSCWPQSQPSQTDHNLCPAPMCMPMHVCFPCDCKVDIVFRAIHILSHTQSILQSMQGGQGWSQQVGFTCKCSPCPCSVKVVEVMEYCFSFFSVPVSCKHQLMKLQNTGTHLPLSGIQSGYHGHACKDCSRIAMAGSDLRSILIRRCTESLPCIQLCTQ